MKIGIGLPAYRSILDVGHAYQWLTLGIELAQQTAFELLYCQHADLCGIEHARNRLTLSALEDGLDWLVMCDADSYVPARPDDPSPGKAILRMIAAGQEAGAAMIGAPMVGRNEARPRMNARRFIANDWRHLSPADVLGRVVEVDRMGTGLVAVNIAWLKEHWPEPPWFQSVCLPGRELKHIGEDDFFCDEAKKRGGAILCDGRCIPAHSDKRTA